MTTPMDTKKALQDCTQLKFRLENLRDALKEVERVQSGGALNPNRPDPRGEVGNAVLSATSLLDSIADNLHGEPKGEAG